MAASFRMQGLINVSSNQAQDHRDAIDVGSYRHVVIQCRVATKDTQTGGTLVIQEANILDDGAFVDVPNVGVNLFTDTNKMLRVSDTARYLRWRVVGLTTSAQFMLDALGREG